MDALLLHQLSPNNRQLTLSCSDLFRPVTETSNAKDKKLEFQMNHGDEAHTVSKPLSRRSHLGETRLVLPITLDREGHVATVLACADTGADMNIISDELARTLGFSSHQTSQEDHRLMLANGKSAKSMGQVTTLCSFSTGAALIEPMVCVFHVLSKLTTPTIMGMQFLQDTNTMTEHRDRFRRIPRPNLRTVSVCAVGRPRMYMMCDVNHGLTMAIPDSGSEIDLVSPQFARARGFQIHPDYQPIELADGSIVISSGFIRTNLSIGTHFDSMHAPRSKVAIAIDFLVLEGLNHDVIVGEHHLEELRVFTENKHALILSTNKAATQELNRIRCPGAVDKSLSWIKQRLSSREGSNPTASGTRCPGHILSQC